MLFRSPAFLDENILVHGSTTTPPSNRSLLFLSLHEIGSCLSGGLDSYWFVRFLKIDLILT